MAIDQQKRRINQQRYYRNHRAKCYERVLRWEKSLRKKVISAYGSRCTCCGETQVEFLVIDHIYNDGAAHRKQIGRKIHAWLHANQWPKDRFQLLCWNCNAAKRLGVCPHKLKIVSSAS